MPEPSPQYLSQEEILIHCVESLVCDEGISATGVLDHILHAARGSELSTLSAREPLLQLSARTRTAISAMLPGVYASGVTCGVNEVCRPVNVQGQSVATPALGDCALYGVLFAGLPFLRPPPLHPDATTCVRIWAVRQMIRGIVPPVPDTHEVMHLQALEPRTIVRLAHLLGIYFTVVQRLSEVFYVVAQPDFPYASGMHAVLWQTPDHYTTFAPITTQSQPLSTPPPSPAMSLSSAGSQSEKRAKNPQGFWICMRH